MARPSRFRRLVPPLRRGQRDLRLERHRRRARRQRPLARDRPDAGVERVAERRREVRALELPRVEARRHRQRDGLGLQPGVLLERLLVALLDRAARLLDDVEEVLGRLAHDLVVERTHLARRARLDGERVALDRHDVLRARPLLAHQPRVLGQLRVDQLLLLRLVLEALLEIRLGLRIGLDHLLALAPGAEPHHHDQSCDDGCTRPGYVSFVLPATGSLGWMPGRSTYSRTIAPPTTCAATTCTTRCRSTRLYKAVVPRGPGSVSKPLPSAGAASVLRISRTRTLGPCVQRPKQLCHCSSVCSCAPYASSARRNTSCSAAEPWRSPHSGPRQITILKRRNTQP